MLTDTLTIRVDVAVERRSGGDIIVGLVFLCVMVVAATWAGWLAVDHKFPDWQTWEQFVGTEAAHAMRTDCMLSTHAIEIPIEDSKLIDQVFDALSYQVRPRCLSPHQPNGDALRHFAEPMPAIARSYVIH